MHIYKHTPSTYAFSLFPFIIGTIQPSAMVSDHPACPSLLSHSEAMQPQNITATLMAVQPPSLVRAPPGGFSSSQVGHMAGAL
jgi:hypothetical protein